MNLLGHKEDEEDNEDYDLDEDREPLAPMPPNKTDEVELEIPNVVVSGGGFSPQAINWDISYIISND